MDGPIRSYRELRVYRKAYEVALEVHRVSLGFPAPEQREIGRQLRQATKSIPANIAEGYGRKASPNDFKRFLQIALGSCDEVRVWLDFCRDLGYLEEESYGRWVRAYEEVGKGLNKLLQVWQKF